MASRAATAVVVLALACAAVHSAATASEGLSMGFHAALCPRLERIVRAHVARAFRHDDGIAPALIRILFHDCFPQGCDASVLLTGNNSEQALAPNANFRPVALNLIERIRAAVHLACGPIVSCAPPATPSSRLINTFGKRSLDVGDLVALSGAHTFGIAHCSTFSDRFTPIIDANPAIDPELALKLKAKCANDVPEGSVNQTLDVCTPNRFDNKYYFDLLARKGLFKSDQGLIDHPDTKSMATKFSVNQAAFFKQFAKSMVKVSNMEVLTGSQGEIRLNCAIPNRRVEGIDTTNDEGHAADM